MFWINLKIGFRNLLKHKVFSFINIFGLAISMSVCLLIISMLIIAVFIAAPLAKLANNAWLIQFAARVNFGFEVISIGILIMLFLGIATILSQTIRTARTNTSEVLRCE